jgi:hypothetical protein
MVASFALNSHEDGDNHGGAYIKINYEEWLLKPVPNGARPITFGFSL